MPAITPGAIVRRTVPVRGIFVRENDPGIVDDDCVFENAMIDGIARAPRIENDRPRRSAH